MTRAPLAGEDAPQRLDATIARWAREWPGTLLGVEHRDEPDGSGHYHWLIRLRGVERDVITLWLSLRQRTVHLECELAPAPGERHEEVYRFCLVRNRALREVHLALGPEDGLYLVSEVPAGEVTIERLDELVGATIASVEELYPTVMTLGHGTWFRRRPSRP
ncbi:MAG TPA: type III secretion system chaperone [Acidimicrobiales bacterium]|nr:type III secretion system chaperone [Acidimicrobiales bacterium]